MSERIAVNPTLLIGVGGFGQKSLLAIRDRLMRTYGSVPLQVKLLSIDTTDREDDVRAVLRDDEFVKLEVRLVAAQIEANLAQLEPWMDLDKIPFGSIPGITHGAGQTRQLGRFSLLYNIGYLLPAVKGALDAMNGWNVGDDTRFYHDARSPRQIVFMGSIAGGTGSGVLLDLACAIGSLPEAQEYDRYAYLAMPGIYRRLPNCHYVEENGYAFLKELDFMQSNGRAIQRGDYGTVFDMQMGPLEYQMREPFDNVLLIDDMSQGDMNFSTPQALAEATAIAVFTTLSGETGGMFGDALVNPANRGIEWDGGMLCQYSGFGVTELYYPRDELVTYGLAVFAERLADQMMLGQAPADREGESLETEVENFLRDNALRGRETEDNEIVAALLSPKPFGARLPKDVKKDADVDEVWQTNEHSLAVYEEDLAKTVATNRATQVERIRALVTAEAEKLLRERGGHYARAFVGKLEGHFEYVRAELEQEAAAAGTEAQRQRDQLSELKAKCREKTKKLFGRREAVANVLASFGEALQRCAQTLTARTRASEGEGLCKSVLAELHILGRTLAQQQEGADSLRKKARLACSYALGRLSSPSPFQIPVQPDIEHLDLPEPDARHFYAWLKDTQATDALAFWAATSEDAHETFLTYAKSLEVDEVLGKATLASALAAKTEAERQEYLDRVAARCQPLIPLDPDVMHALRDPRHRPTNIYLVGASFEFHELFTNAPDAQGKIRDLRSRMRMPGQMNPHAHVIADANRAYFLRYFGAVPAYALESFQLLRSEYQETASQERAWSLHLDKRWDDILPDLDPRASDAHEGLWVWALATSDIDYLQMITKTGTHYSFDSHEVASDGTALQMAVHLGQGAAQARKTFFARRDWVVQVESRLMEAITRVGNERILTDLDALNERRKAEYSKAKKDRADESRLKEIRAEIDAVAAFGVMLRA